jgi:hypothetical protein
LTNTIEKNIIGLIKVIIIITFVNKERRIEMLYDYLLANYKAAEPIFFSDIKIEGISRPALNQHMRRLCEEKKLEKYEPGVYYIPKKSRLNGSVGINADMVARYKYIERNGRVQGFYSGNFFANQLGISTQVPNKVEIVSNNIAANIREIPIGKRTFIIRKSHISVNEDNVFVLQILELLKNLDAYLDDDYKDAREKFRRYIDAHGITRAEVDQYIRKYPVTIFKYYYELRLDDVLA